MYTQLYADFLATVKKLKKSFDLSARPETLSITMLLFFFSHEFTKNIFINKISWTKIDILTRTFLYVRQQFFKVTNITSVMKFSMNFKQRFYFCLLSPGKFNLRHPLYQFKFPNTKRLFLAIFWTNVVFPHSVCPTTSIFPSNLPSYLHFFPLPFFCCG